MRRTYALAVALAVGAGAVGAGAIVGRGAADPEPVAPAAATTPPPDADATAGRSSDRLIEHRDDAGFAISYPSTWRRLDAADTQVRLAATPNGADSLLVRVIELDGPVEPSEVPAFERLTRDLVTASEGVELLADPRRIELDGVPGYFYFYAFDDASGQRGAHSHYFLFAGSRLITIVFQALPVSRFRELAPTFDAIAASFRLTDDHPGGADR